MFSMLSFYIRRILGPVAEVALPILICQQYRQQQRHSYMQTAYWKNSIFLFCTTVFFYSLESYYNTTVPKYGSPFIINIFKYCTIKKMKTIYFWIEPANLNQIYDQFSILAPLENPNLYLRSIPRCIHIQK